LGPGGRGHDRLSASFPRRLSPLVGLFCQQAIQKEGKFEAKREQEAQSDFGFGRVRYIGKQDANWLDELFPTATLWDESDRFKHERLTDTTTTH